MVTLEEKLCSAYCLMMWASKHHTEPLPHNASGRIPEEIVQVSLAGYCVLAGSIAEEEGHLLACAFTRRSVERSL